MKSIDRLRLGTNYYGHRIRKKSYSVMWHDRWMLFDEIQYDRLTVIERTDQFPVTRFMQGVGLGELTHMDKTNRNKINRYKRLKRFFKNASR